MSILPIPAFNDNYIWLIRQGSQVVCVDPGDATPVQHYLQAHRLTLDAIWLTHHHQDHIGGVEALKQSWPQALVYGLPAWGAHVEVGEGSSLSLGTDSVTVWAVPGHTDTHLAYLWSHQGQCHVFCGDTLFSGGCGRVFTGTMAQLLASLQRFNNLPEDTLFYPAHEYTKANLRFAQAVEPCNADIQAALAAAAHTPTLPVSLAHERRINPFLRTHIPAVQAAAEGLDSTERDDPLAVFTALREWKNRF